ncbi:unnamed protein product, partial [Polarella glacialis]
GFHREAFKALEGTAVSAAGCYSVSIVPALRRCFQHLAGTFAAEFPGSQRVQRCESFAGLKQLLVWMAIGCCEEDLAKVFGEHQQELTEFLGSDESIAAAARQSLQKAKAAVAKKCANAGALNLAMATLWHAGSGLAVGTFLKRRAALFEGLRQRGL